MSGEERRALVQRMQRCWALSVDSLKLGEVQFLSRAQRSVEEGQMLTGADLGELERIERRCDAHPTESESPQSADDQTHE